MRRKRLDLKVVEYSHPGVLANTDQVPAVLRCPLTGENFVREKCEVFYQDNKRIKIEGKFSRKFR